MTRNNRLLLKIASFSLILVLLALASLGCVQTLQPLGWSGGTISGDTLFVGSEEGKLVAIGINDNSHRWSEPLRSQTPSGGLSCAAPALPGCAPAPAGVAIYGAPAVSGDLVYIAGYNGKINAYNSTSMALRWVYPREGNLQPIVGGLVVAQGKLLFGGSEGKVYALDATTGDKLWEFETGDKVWATPTVDGDTVYIGSFDNKLYALRINDGSLKWEFQTEGSIAAASLVVGGTVYIGSFDRYLYAINSSDGSPKWKFMGGNWFWAKPIVSDDTIYAGNLDGKVYALKAQTGDKVAEFDLGSPIASSPVMAKDSVIFASEAGTLYAVATGTNTIKQLADIKKDIFGSLAINQGIIYIHTQDLTIHRVNADSGSILESISLKSG